MSIDQGMIVAGQAAIEDGVDVALKAFAAAREQLGPDTTDAEVRTHADWLLDRAEPKLLDPARIDLAAQALVEARGAVWDAQLRQERTHQRGVVAAVVAAYHGMGR